MIYFHTLLIKTVLSEEDEQPEDTSADMKNTKKQVGTYFALHQFLFQFDRLLSKRHELHVISLLFKKGENKRQEKQEQKKVWKLQLLFLNVIFNFICKHENATINLITNH